MNKYLKIYLTDMLKDDDLKEDTSIYNIFTYPCYNKYLDESNFTSHTIEIDPVTILDRMQSLVRIKQIRKVTIKYSDIKGYLNAYKLSIANNPDTKYSDYTYINNVEENLEYNGETDTLFIGNKLLSKLSLHKRTEYECLICLYDMHKAITVPSFITDYDKTSDIPLLKDLLKYDRTTLTVREFVNESHVLVKVPEEPTYMVHYINLTQDIIGKIARKNKLLYYDLDKGEYKMLIKSISSINDLLYSFTDQGNMTPLVLQLSLNEDFATPIKCNTPFIMSLILGYPIVTAVVISPYGDELPDDLSSESKTKYLKQLEQFFAPYVTYKVLSEEDMSDGYKIIGK